MRTSRSSRRGPSFHLATNECGQTVLDSVPGHGEQDKGNDPGGYWSGVRVFGRRRRLYPRNGLCVLQKERSDGIDRWRRERVMATSGVSERVSIWKCLRYLLWQFIPRRRRGMPRTPSPTVCVLSCSPSVPTSTSTEPHI